MRTFAAMIVLAMLPGSAGADYLGGVAEGMREAEQLSLQRQALELDRRHGTNHYERLRQQQQMEELQRSIDENNRLLRAQQWRRILGW